jgi:hypothetical protein
MTEPSWVRRVFPVAPNYRGKPVGVWLGVAFTAGVAMVVTVVLVATVLARGGLTPVHRRLLVIGAGCLAVFAAGSFDDFRPVPSRGLLRQVRALMRGRVMSGVVKLAVIVVAAAAVGWGLGGRGARLAVGIPVVAGAANLWNLLDVAPGRALKFFLPAVAALAFTGDRAGYPVLAGAAVGAGAVALVIDLRELAMLGDAGSNVIGFIVGVGAFLAFPIWALGLALAALLVLHALAETVTLSRLIRGAPLLRWLDDLGRVPSGKSADGARGRPRDDPPTS